MALSEWFVTDGFETTGDSPETGDGFPLGDYTVSFVDITDSTVKVRITDNKESGPYFTNAVGFQVQVAKTSAFGAYPDMQSDNPADLADAMSEERNYCELFVQYLGSGTHYHCRVQRDNGL